MGRCRCCKQTQQRNLRTVALACWVVERGGRLYSPLAQDIIAEGRLHGYEVVYYETVTSAEGNALDVARPRQHWRT